jgi:hypothetical protein
MKTLLTFGARFLRCALVNYKTSLTGLAMITHATLVIVDSAASVANGTGDINPTNLLLAKAEIMGGLGFLASRDADKSSQDNGLRK